MKFVPMAFPHRPSGTTIQAVQRHFMFAAMRMLLKATMDGCSFSLAALI